MAQGLTQRLKAQGFDRSYPVPFERGWAIQREDGGPYWNEREGSWR